jgi:uncharacterized protein with GYD domain
MSELRNLYYERRFKTMGKYLIEETLASQVIAGILKNPEDRMEPVRRIFESAGCKLEHFYASLIENKTYLIVESPDLKSIYAVTANFLAAGAASSIKCSPLITTSEAVDMFKKAASLPYRPPGK